MSEAVTRYLEARAAFERANGQRKSLAKKIETVASAVERRPGQFRFSNTGQSFSIETVFGKDILSIPAQEWPDAKQINDVLTKFSTSKKEMNDAWAAIQNAYRSGLQPPPDVY